MIDSIPHHRRGPLEEALEALKVAQGVVLTTHVHADGDGAGSEVALAGWLRSRGKNAWIVNPTPFPGSLGFLLPETSWFLDPGSSAARERFEEVDLAVVLDTGEESRIGRVGELIGGLSTVVIDHHPPGAEPIPGISVRDPDACATGELVFDLITLASGPWAPEVVQGLYVALLADTGGFRFSNTSSRTHRIAAFLMEMGADPEKLHRSVYGNVPLRRLRLLKDALGTLDLDEDGRLAWMTIPSDSYEDLGARAEDVEGLVDYPRSIVGVEVGILFRRVASGATKVSFRSNGGVDVNALARQFGGGGHVRASGALVEGPLAEVRARVLEAAREALEERVEDAGE
jgi:phosphoesterase RecJ-like protein